VIGATAGSGSGAELAAAVREAVASGPSAAMSELSSSDLEIYVLSTGGSTGAVAQLFAVNRSGQALRLPSGPVVLEPVRISADAQARIGALLQGMIDGGTAPQTVVAYCLQFLRKPPAAGTVMRIASADIQERFARYHRLLDAAARLRDAGRLNADSDASEYLDAIRQWSIWTVEERFDARSFTDAFVRATRRNLEAAREKWTDEIERKVRALAPNRWNDIQAVLREAGLQ
jgi:hypothetical protein